MGGLTGACPKQQAHIPRERLRSNKQTDCLFPIPSASPDLDASQRWARRHPETARGRNPDMASAWSWHGTWMMLGNKKPESQLQRRMSRILLLPDHLSVYVYEHHISRLCVSQFIQSLGHGRETQLRGETMKE
ncbi:hypothetical protein FALCPG4_002062 [Fusarium falciforme]